ncbi:MAG: zinc ribbon domain-containing protein [Faecousia sp.]
MAKFCGNCGMRFDDRANVCSNCGTRLTECKAAAAVCPRCGNSEISENAMYCSRCGKRMRKRDSGSGRRMAAAALAVAVVAAALIIWRCLDRNGAPEAQSGPQTGTVMQTKPASTTGQPTAAANPPAEEIQFSYYEDENGQYAEIVGLDAQKNTQWVYTSDIYDPGTQAPVISEMLCKGDRYYFCEDGAIVVLDTATGDVIWKNGDFQGCCPVGYVDGDGTAYISGYMGPDFFAVDANGRTIHRIGSFDVEYCWAKKVEKIGDKIAVFMDIGPYYQGSKDYVFFVDPDDFSYEFQGSIDEI